MLVPYVVLLKPVAKLEAHNCLNVLCAAALQFLFTGTKRSNMFQHDNGWKHGMP